MDRKHAADPKEVELPSSYAELPFEQLRLFHAPESSKEVTPIVIVQLYRPKNYNAFTEKLMRELETAFELFDIDSRIKCVVLTGHGKMFCAGADLDIGFSRGLAHVKDNRDGGGRVSLAIHRCRKPTIAALHGAAVGVGITMTLPFTIRIAYEKAKIGFVFSRRGIIMEACSSYFLPKLVGYVHL
jgi:enoyl-CoA hydratase/carnithine racemase